jgi:Zn-finger nucleic acid-binding protein
MLEDRNAAIPVDYCPRCGGEIYDHEEVCEYCRERSRSKARRYDQYTVEAVMEEVDYFAKLYLSEDMCTTLWNNLCDKFRAEEE